MVILYHGSIIEMKKYIEPTPSQLLRGDQAVFASTRKELILPYLGDIWNNSEIEVTSYRFKTYIIEKKPDMFKKKFANKTGFLYELSDKKFKYDARVSRFEMIKKTKCRIKKKIIVDNILKELKKSNIIMIKYSQLHFIYLNKKAPLCKTIKLDRFDFAILETLPIEDICIKCTNIHDNDIKKNLNVSSSKKIKKIGIKVVLNTKIYTIYFLEKN